MIDTTLRIRKHFQLIAAARREAGVAPGEPLLGLSLEEKLPAPIGESSHAPRGYDRRPGPAARWEAP